MLIFISYVCILSRIKSVFFLLSDVTYGRHHRRNANRLDILPKGPHTFPIGKNSFFTCRAHVHNPGLVKNLKWIAPNGMEIPQDDRYRGSQTNIFHALILCHNLWGNECEKS